MVSGVFQRGQLRLTWMYYLVCACFCQVEISLPEAEISRSKSNSKCPIFLSFRVRQKFSQPLNEMSFWETFLNICYFFKKPNLVHTDQKRILLWKVLFSIMLSLNAFQQIILIKSQTTPNFFVRILGKRKFICASFRIVRTLDLYLIMKNDRRNNTWMFRRVTADNLPGK